MTKKKIGLMGLSFISGNKGCVALAYSFLEVLHSLSSMRDEQYELYIFTNSMSHKMLPKVCYNSLRYHLTPIKCPKPIRFMENRMIQNCDVIFDFTAGDSFTDIYGMDRFNDRTALKEKVINLNVPLILGSQTYGPFSSEQSKMRAAEVLKKATAIFSRDELSSSIVFDLSGRNAIETTDIAFMLPYHKDRKAHQIKKIGINPSGLLWSGGYTQNNQFSLSVNYREYITRLVKELVELGDWEIHLIQHVFTQNPNIVDNDAIPCRELKEQFPSVIEAPVYELPMDIKSYISSMDLFIGSRMHATIAAFSSGTAVIPFSYSRKFEGLYKQFKYDYIISGRELTTEAALKTTLDWVNQYMTLKEKVRDCSEHIDQLNKRLISETSKCLDNIWGK